MIKLKEIECLLYFDGPLLTQYRYKNQDFLFVLLDEKEFTFIGKKVSLEEINDFVNGKICLRSLFEKIETKYYIGKYAGDKFCADIFSGPVTEDMLPDYGLFI